MWEEGLPCRTSPLNLRGFAAQEVNPARLAFLKATFSPDPQNHQGRAGLPIPARHARLTERLGARPGTPGLNISHRRAAAQDCRAAFWLTLLPPGLGPSGAAGGKSHQQFDWGCFSVTHLPDFLQQTALNSWVAPSSRADVLVGGGQKVTRWVPCLGSPRRPTERSGSLHSARDTGLGRLFTGFCY